MRIFIQSAKTDSYRQGQWVTIANHDSPSETAASTLLMQVLPVSALVHLWGSAPQSVLKVLRCTCLCVLNLFSIRPEIHSK